MNNTQFITTTSKITVPATATKTGTLKTTGTDVIGTGTKFVSEYRIGDYLPKLSTNELQKIVAIANDTNMYLEAAFAVDLPALTAATVVPASRIKILEYAVTGAGAGAIDGQTVKAGSKGKWEKPRQGTSQIDFLDPVIIDGSGTTIELTITLR